MTEIIDRAHLWRMLMDLAEITEPDQPYTRRSFTPRFLEGRAWLEAQMQAAGLDTRIDHAGNLIGRLRGNGSKPGVIAIGSHSDTVPGGGRFDGIAGVIAALACVQSWRARGITFNHDVEVVDYLAEEPSEWGLSCIGSRGITGFLSDAHLATPHPHTGETLAQAITRMGGKPDQLAVRKDIAAAFELHIEQGHVLESEGVDVGIVSGIVGIVRVEVVLEGQANHAGTTPMHLRRDALACAAQVVLEAEDLARRMAQAGEGYFVATCGQVFATPNASNVIAGACRLVFDIRSDQKDLLERFVAQLDQAVARVATARDVRCTRFARLSDTTPALSDAQLMEALAQAAQMHGISAKVMPSGAGHDAAFMSHIAPMVMLFVPSQAGKSHCPEEWTDESALHKGVTVLCAAVELYDKK